VEQVDGFAGRVEAKRVELSLRASCPLAERLNNGGLPDGEVVANLGSEIRKLCEVGGQRFRVALLPTQTPASREPCPPLICNWAGFGPKNATGVDERRNCDERIVFR
jgi:hypothetical protein